MRGFPPLRDLALLDRSLHFIIIALLGGRHHGRIDNLAIHLQITAVGQRRIEAHKQLVDCLCLPSLSRSGRTVVASGNLPSSPSPRNCWSDTSPQAMIRSFRNVSNTNERCG